jgi:hypothetical protein
MDWWIHYVCLYMSILSLELCNVTVGTVRACIDVTYYFRWDNLTVSQLFYFLCTFYILFYNIKYWGLVFWSVFVCFCCMWMIRFCRLNNYPPFSWFIICLPFYIYFDTLGVLLMFSCFIFTGRDRFAVYIIAWRYNACLKTFNHNYQTPKRTKPLPKRFNDTQLPTQPSNL